MSDQGGYWSRQLGRTSVTRRRLLGGAAMAGAAAASISLVGCGSSKPASTPTAGAKPSSSPAPSNTPAATPTAAPKPGGVYRTSSANATYDTFDASRSRFTPFATIIGLTMQRIIQWDNFAKGILGGAFADSWEQPDPLTLRVHLRPNNYWQDKPPVNGRKTTVQDMQFHIERNKAGKLQNGKSDPNFYRMADYQVVDTVTTPDAANMVVTFKKPAPLFVNLLAQSYEGIQAPEAVKAFEAIYNQFKASEIIGTGPYVLTAFNPDGHLTYKKYDRFWGTTYLAGHTEVPLFTDQAALQAAFEQKQVDSFSPSTVTQLNDLSSRYKGQLSDSPGYAANPVSGTYYGGAPPWNNANLIGAIFRAYDRRQLIQQFHGGRGAISGNIPPTQQAFGIDDKELSTYPGYLTDRATEVAAAKQMWQAGGGPALGTVTLDVPDIFEGVYQASSVLISMLNQNLGTSQFTAKIENYATISTKVSQRKYGNGNANIWYGWVTDLTDPEPTSYMVSNYETGQTNWKQFGVTVPGLDPILQKLDVDLNLAERKDLNKQAERLILKAWGAGQIYSHVQIVDTLNWNYFHPWENAPFSTAHLIVNAWIDPADPSSQGRPPDPTL